MADWPISLPAPLISGCKYESARNVIRTEMEAGTAKMRRRFTAAPEELTFALRLSQAQVQTLLDFHDITLGAVLTFNWTEFRKPEGPENVAVYRFKQRPSFMPTQSGMQWQATCMLELLTAFSVPPLSIGGSLVSGLVGVEYSQTLYVAGGRAPYSITSWSLAAGLAPSIEGNVISVTGVPTASSPGPFTITITDAAGASVTYTAVAQITSVQAAVVILLGQSLNASRETKVLQSSWADAYMFNDGVSVAEFDYFAAQNEDGTNYASVASAVPFAEGVGQSPAVGLATMLDNGTYARGYFCSVAVGSRSMQVLNQTGLRANVYAMTQRFVDIARAAGFTPRPLYYSAHGEANATAATTEAAYYALGMDYYRMVRACAAQALGDPTYVAPLILSYPAQTNAGGSGANNRAINEAIRRISEDLGAKDFPTYPFPCRADRTHNTDEGQVLRGEYAGLLSRGTFSASPRIVSVTLSGTTFVATLDQAIVRDATVGVGSNLNTAIAEDGFEWTDNGTEIAIVSGSLVYGMHTITGTLASAPVGSLGQQTLRYACQATTASLTAGASNLAGGNVRASVAGVVSMFDPTFTHYPWAIPQTFDSVQAP